MNSRLASFIAHKNFDDWNDDTIQDQAIQHMTGSLIDEIKDKIENLTHAFDLTRDQQELLSRQIKELL